MMGLLNSLIGQSTRASNTPLLDRLCRENGLEIALRDDKTVALIFKADHITRQRTVSVSHGEGDAVMCFRCPCRATFPSRTLPENLLTTMLTRNADVPMGAWVAQIDDGRMKLSLKYTALTGGINATTFQRVCTLMLKEVAEVEAFFASKRLL